MMSTAQALILEARDLPDPERNLLSHNERELINLAKQLADALADALDQIPEPRPFTAD